MHHAYLLIGDTASAEEFLNSFLSERGVEVKASPDYFVWKEPLFGIDEARMLSVAAARRAFGERKIFFIAPQKLTLEAQNALLKTFEDPIDNTHFFLASREEELIIPTLRSRVEILKVGGIEEGSEIKKFLSLAIKDRMAYVKKFVDAEKNISVFLDNLMLFLRREEKFDDLKKVHEARKFSADRSASSRLILEHLSLVL